MFVALALVVLQAAPAEADLDSAFAALSEAGFPKMASKYREVEVSGTCEAPATKRGWVSDDGRTALTWEGVVLPVVKAGPIVDLNAEVRTLAPRTAHAIQVMIIANQGTRAQASALWKAMARHSPETPLQQMATDWQLALLDQAVCAHRQSRDEDALAALETIESLTKRGLVEKHEEATELLADQRRRQKNARRPVLAFTATPSNDELLNWLDHLDDVGQRPAMQLPGFIDDAPVDLRHEPVVRALARMGAPIADQLIDATENDTRLSRVLPKSKFRERLVPVSEVAYAVVDQLFDPGFSEDEQTSKKARAALLRTRWAEWKRKGPAERAVATLDNDLSTTRWSSAARELRRAIETGDAALGSLHARPAPSVTSVLIRRLSADDACEVSKTLAKWDPEPALDALQTHLVTLKKQELMVSASNHEARCLPWVAELLADQGRPQGLEALAEVLKTGAPGSEHVELACKHTENAKLQAALTVALGNAARKTTSVAFAPGRDWAPLLHCPAFTGFLKRQLADQRPMKLAGRQRRVADWYANELAVAFPVAPQFQIDGTPAVRGAALKAMKAWVAELAP